MSHAKMAVRQGSVVLERLACARHTLSASAMTKQTSTLSGSRLVTSNRGRVGGAHRSFSAFARVGRLENSAAPSLRILHAPSMRPSMKAQRIQGGMQKDSIQTRSLSLWPFASSPSTSPSTAPAPVSAPTPAPAPTLPSSSLPDVAATEGHGANEGVDAATSAAVDTAEQIVNFSDVALSWWPNVKALQYITDWLVETTGLPWWANIVIVTAGVRALVLPLVLRGQTNAIRLGNIQPKMQVYMKEIQYAKSAGDQRLMGESVGKVQKLMKDNDCHPMRSLLAPVVQTPIFVSFFFALRSLAEQGLTSMKTGGLAWFSDLTAADPNTILPILSAASMLIIIETGAELGGGGAQQNTRQAKIMRNVLRGASVLTIPFLWNLPAAVFVYWLTNNTFSILQLLILQLPAVRKALKIPKRIDRKKIEEDDGPRSKPMGFWDSLKAGKDSQMNVSARTRNVGRHSVPSVLQDQRRVEETRERALQRIMRDFNTPVDDAAPSVTAGTASSSTSVKDGQQDRLRAAQERRKRRSQH